MSSTDYSSGSLMPTEPPEEQTTTPATPGAAESPTLPGESGALSAGLAPGVVATAYPSGPFVEQPPASGPLPGFTSSGALPAIPDAQGQSGQQPYTVVGQVVMTPSGMMVVPPAAAKPPWYRALARPLPFWARAVGVALIVAALVAVFFIRQAQGNDWADSLRDTGLAAGALAALFLLATIARAFAGLAARANPTRRRQLVSASVLLGVLLIFAGEGVGLQSPVHFFQGHVLEGQQQWERALAEYRLAGQRPPDSDALARVYVEWGEQLHAGKRYADALARFDIVLMTYPRASAEVSRAQTDKVNNYFDWASQASAQQNYQAATSYYDTLLGLPYCAQNCQDRANRLDATAYYNLAEQFLANGNYFSAVAAFQTLQARFGSSPEAQQIHPDLAKALLGEGEQQRQSDCPSAIPTFQELIQQFSDTPQGQQAQSEYNAPEPVTGTFEGALAYLGGAPVAVLVQGLYPDIPTDQFFQLINSGYATLISDNGAFSFKPVPQGTYDLAWGSVDQFGDAVFSYSVYTANNQLVYVANVGPLCPYDFSYIPEDVPLR